MKVWLGGRLEPTVIFFRVMAEILFLAKTTLCSTYFVRYRNNLSLLAVDKIYNFIYHSMKLLLLQNFVHVVLCHYSYFFSYIYFLEVIAQKLLLNKCKRFFNYKITANYDLQKLTD